MLDDSKHDSDSSNGTDGVPPKKAKKQYPVDLPLEVVLGKMPPKVRPS